MRVTFAAAALIALAAAASFVVRSERQISKLTSSARAFDLNAALPHPTKEFDS